MSFLHIKASKHIWLALALALALTTATVLATASGSAAQDSDPSTDPAEERTVTVTLRVFNPWDEDRPPIPDHLRPTPYVATPATGTETSATMNSGIAHNVAFHGKAGAQNAGQTVAAQLYKPEHVLPPLGALSLTYQSKNIDEIKALKIRKTFANGANNGQTYIIIDDENIWPGEDPETFDWIDFDVAPGATYTYETEVIWNDDSIQPLPIVDNSVVMSNFDSLTLISTQTGDPNYITDQGAIRLQIEPANVPVSRLEVLRWHQSDSGSHVISTRRLDATPNADNSAVYDYVDSNVVNGDLYAYQVRYYGAEPAPGVDSTEVVETTAQNIARAGIRRIGNVTDLTARYSTKVDRGGVDLEWQHPKGEQNQTMAYLILRIPGEREFFSGMEVVGETRNFNFRDWTAEPDTFYRYQVVQLMWTHHNHYQDDGKEIEIGRLTISCIDSAGGTQAITGYGLGPTRFLDRESDVSEVYKADADNMSVQVYFDNNDKKKKVKPYTQCASFKENELNVQRRLIYAHQVDSETCPSTQSCDTVGGVSTNEPGDFQVVTGKWADDLANLDRKRFTAPSAFPQGVFQYEYKVCTEGRPAVCSVGVPSVWHLQNVTAIPFSTAAAP